MQNNAQKLTADITALYYSIKNNNTDRQATINKLQELIELSKLVEQELRERNKEPEEKIPEQKEKALLTRVGFETVSIKMMNDETKHDKITISIDGVEPKNEDKTAILKSIGKYALMDNDDDEQKDYEHKMIPFGFKVSNEKNTKTKGKQIGADGAVFRNIKNMIPNATDDQKDKFKDLVNKEYGNIDYLLHAVITVKTVARDKPYAFKYVKGGDNGHNLCPLNEPLGKYMEHMIKINNEYKKEYNVDILEYLKPRIIGIGNHSVRFGQQTELSELKESGDLIDVNKYPVVELKDTHVELKFIRINIDIRDFYTLIQ